MAPSEGTPPPSVKDVMRHIAAVHPTSQLTESDLLKSQNRNWFYPHCEICGRHVLQTKRHQHQHASGELDVRGIRTDPTGQATTAKRLTSRYGRARRPRAY